MPFNIFKVVHERKKKYIFLHKKLVYLLFYCESQEIQNESLHD